MHARMFAKYLLPGIAKAGIKPVGDEGAAALAAFEQTARRKLLYGFAQGGPGNAKLHRQFAFRRQAVARLQAPLQHALFNFTGHHVSKAWRYHARVHGSTIALV
jgi:hypothetical protein